MESIPERRRRRPSYLEDFYTQDYSIEIEEDPGSEDEEWEINDKTNETEDSTFYPSEVRIRTCLFEDRFSNLFYNVIQNIKDESESDDENESKQNEEKNYETIWNSNYRSRKMDAWTFFSGAKNLDSSSTPFQIFRKLWSSEVQRSIISESKKKEKNFNLDSKLFDLYIAALLIMGIAPMSTISHYWKQDSNGILGNNFIKNLSKKGLTRDMFKFINAHIHINSKFLIHELNENFKQFYDPEQFVTIDECLSLFKGKKYKKL